MSANPNRDILNKKPIGEPIKLYNDQEGKPQFNKEGVSKVLMSHKNKNKPVVVVSIAGLKRKGKSFMLNILMRYFSSGCSQNWMEDKDTPLEGFEWRGGSVPATTGIWMWSEVFTVTSRTGKKVRVILLDNEGFISQELSKDTTLLSLNLLFSSIQIFNISEDINKIDINTITKASAEAKKFKEKLKLQTLLFLIRDWPHEHEEKFGRSGGKQHLHSCLRKIDGANFRKLECFLLPIPDRCIVTGKSDGCIKDMSENFQEYLNQFVQTMRDEILKSKKKKCKDVCKSFEKYIKKAAEKKELDEDQRKQKQMMSSKSVDVESHQSGSGSLDKDQRKQKQMMSSKPGKKCEERVNNKKHKERPRRMGTFCSV